MRKSPTKLPSKEEIQLGFGAAVRRLRDSKELTQEQLAELSDVHVTYVSQIERGLKNLSLFNIHRIAHALGVSAGNLLLEAERR
jgi:transcriptional regulator with XRE-family HTH domain